MSTHGTNFLHQWIANNIPEQGEGAKGVGRRHAQHIAAGIARRQLQSRADEAADVESDEAP
jgi:hypothetical protein